MTTLAGTLTESLDPFDWVAYAHRIDTGALVGLAEVVNGAFAIDCGSITEACLVTVAPKMGRKWQPGETLAVGAYRIPTAPTATPYVYRAVAVDTTTDPYQGNVALMLRCNGADGSTAFQDLSDYAHAVTAYGNAKVSTAQSKFGGASVSLNGSNSFLAIAQAGTEFQFGAGDFTIECWAYQTQTDTNRCLWGFGESQPMRLLTASGSIVLHGPGGSAAITTTEQIGAAWKHVAVVRQSGVVRLYVNGVQAGSAWNYAGDLNMPASGLFRAGCNRGDTWFFAGYLDDIRITKGLARYTGAFQPPTELGTDSLPTGASEPAWPTTVGQTVLDNGVTWECVSRLVQPITHGPLIPA